MQSQSNQCNLFGRFRSWPITATSSLEGSLRQMGLKVPAAVIDGTSGSETSPCLSDSLVSVGPAGRGGTGSFISEEGLIITNWHVAHDAVRQASNKDGTDYLSTGFAAHCREDELRGADYEVWITKSCRDVSSTITEVSRTEMDPLLRANKIRDCSQAVAKAEEENLKIAEKGSTGTIRCDVQEMWPNESYVLFTYERLQDVRIVYVPSKHLGNFGGDSDNFEWPRHTADFTLLRAYVGPDGCSAPPHENNIPYTSTASLRVNSAGAKEGDLVFLLGFPGHTMRYAPSARLKYSEEIAVPSLIKDFGHKLSLIESHENKSDLPLLKLAGVKKSLANEFKRSNGKCAMMKRLQLIPERQAEENELCKKAPEAQLLLARLHKIYVELSELEKTSAALEKLRGVYAGSALLYVGHTVHEASCIELSKPDNQREVTYRDRNRAFLESRVLKRLGDIHDPFEIDLIKDALKAASCENGNSLFADAVANFPNVTDTVSSTSLRHCTSETLSNVLERGIPDDPFVCLARTVYPCYARNRDAVKSLLSERDEIQASLLEIQRQHSSEKFYPDANGTLRLSVGFVEGYEPADAVWLKPLTTLKGLQEKATSASSDISSNNNDYVCPIQLHNKLDEDSNAKNIPVNILYSTDTVGGNSGSPVLSAEGEFVAINFDRQREGLMNEFKWSPNYSRSIGVDVRYILWLIGEYDKVPALLNEILRRND